MTRSARLCTPVCFSLLLALLGAPAVLSAPAAAVSAKAAPDVADFADWSSVRDKTICPAQVAYDQELRVLQVWCADGVEGQTFAARGAQYVCRSLRYAFQSGGTVVDVLGGCIARLDDAKPQD